MISRDQWLGTTAIEQLTRAEAGNRGRKIKKRAVTPGEVEAVAACLPRVPAAMLRLQGLTGMRPGEVCAMRWCDIDREGAEIDGVRCWIYTVPDAKTSHHGHATSYVLGPRAQHILTGFPPKSPSAAIFSPAETMEELHTLRLAARRTKVTAYTLRRDSEADREVGRRYSTMIYRQAVERACAKAMVERFTPHEVRHGFLTRAAQRYGAFAASSAANHTRVTTTENYVHQRREDALRVVVGLEEEA
jgi:integrase